MGKKFLMLFVCTMMSASIAWAQTRTVTGTVVDSETGEQGYFRTEESAKGCQEGYRILHGHEDSRRCIARRHEGHPDS